MPQTSPMNWVILSLAMVMSITYTMANFSEKIYQKHPSKTNYLMTLQSWNW